MDAEYIKQNCKFELITPEHDLSSFECDSEDLNSFIKDDALREQRYKFNITNLIVCDGEIIGFFSLAADSIKLSELESDEKELFESKTDYKKIPSIKIGRFAIDKKYSGKGLGSFLLIKIMNIVFIISNNDVGVRFITVDGYANAYNFYKKHDFKHFKAFDKDIEKLDKVIRTDPEKPISLYCDLYSFS